LTDVEKTVLGTTPTDVYAFGTSMGGLISALEDQNSDGRLNGSLTTCGLVQGGNNLNQYQLDGEYAIAQLLASSESIQLTNYTVPPAEGSTDSLAAANEMLAAMATAQTTPQGQARLALAFAFLNVSPWGDPAQPGLDDYSAWEQGQYDDYTTGLFGGPVNAIQFIVEGREQIEAGRGRRGVGDRRGQLRQAARAVFVLPRGQGALRQRRPEPAERPPGPEVEREPDTRSGGVPLAREDLGPERSPAGAGARPAHDLGSADPGPE
jgi:hypothetical protein